MLGKAYEAAMAAPRAGERAFALRQQVLLDGTTLATVVGKTIETRPVYDLRIDNSEERNIMLYVPAERITPVETPVK